MKKLAISGLLAALGSTFLTFWFYWEGCASFPCVATKSFTKLYLIALIGIPNCYLLFFFYLVYHKENTGQFPWSNRIKSKGVLDERKVAEFYINSIHTYSRIRWICYLAVLLSIFVGAAGIIISNNAGFNLNEVAGGNPILFMELTDLSDNITYNILSFYIPLYLLSGMAQFAITSWITFKGFPTHD